MASEIHTESVFGSTLLDSSGQPNIVIASSQSHKLIWTLLNNQDQDFVVTPFTSGKVDQNQYHFRLDFSPGTLTNVPTVQDWEVFAQKDENGGIKSLYIALLGNKLTINPNHSHATSFAYTRAIQEDSNNSKVGVRVTTGNNVTVGGTGIPNRTIGPFLLALVHEDAPPLSAPPLAVDFVGRRTVLNDGLTTNNFTFALTNMMQADLPLTPAGGKDATVLTVWFDAAPNEGKESYPWALARIQDLSSEDFNLTGPSSDWKITKSVQASKDVPAVGPRWSITLNKPIALKPQDPVLFTFKGLKTNLDPGITRMYLLFENLSIYRPGVLVGELEKTPLLYGPAHGNGLYLAAGVPSKTPPAPNYDSALFVQQFGTAAAAIFNGGRVGIGTGTNAPAAKLHIQDADQNPDAGSLIIGSGISGDPTLRFGCQPDYAWIQSHGGKPLAINPLPRNVGIGVNQPGSALSIAGGVAIGKNYAQNNTTVAQNDLAVEGKVGVGTTDAGSSLSVAGGVAIGKSYAHKTTTVAENNVAVEGKVSIGTTAPSAALQIGDNSLAPKMFSDVTTVGIVQRASDNVALSLRKFDGNAVMQFCVYDKTGKNLGCNYIQADKENGDILIGDAGKVRATTKGVLEFGSGVAGKQIDAGKVGYKIFSDGLDIVGAGDKNTGRQVRVWDQLQTANLALTGGATMRGDNKQVFEFGFGVSGKQADAGKIGYKVFSPGLDIVGATSDIQNRQIHLWDEVYVRGNLWLMSGGFWCRLDAVNPVKTGAWDWAVYRSSSDLRLKRDVTPIESPRDKVRKLSGCTYHWNEEAITHFTKPIETLQPVDHQLTAEETEGLRKAEREKQRKILEERQVGVIAQEVEAVLPQAVTTGQDGYKTVDYNQLIPLLIEAIKEQDREIEQLKSRLAKAQL